MLTRLEIMRSVIAQKNAAGPVLKGRWVLHEVLHGVSGPQPGHTFSFIIRLESSADLSATTSHDKKGSHELLPGY